MQDEPSRPWQEIASQLSQEKIGERVLELCEELTQALEQEQESLCAATDKDPSITQALMTGERGFLCGGASWATLPIVHAQCADDAAITTIFPSEHTTATGADGFVRVALKADLAYSRWLQFFHKREYILELPEVYLQKTAKACSSLQVLTGGTWLFGNESCPALGAQNFIESHSAHFNGMDSMPAFCAGSGERSHHLFIINSTPTNHLFPIRLPQNVQRIFAPLGWPLDKRLQNNICCAPCLSLQMVLFEWAT